MSKTKVLITGASGFIGKKMCSKFKEEGYEVIALSRKRNERLWKLGVEQVIADLNDPKIEEKLPTNLDLCVHCAANASFGGVKLDSYENVSTTRTLVNHLNRISCPLIFLSSIGAMDRKMSDNCSRAISETSPCHPKSEYGKGKMKCEELIKKSGIKYTIIRPALVVGDEMRADSHLAVFARLGFKYPFIAKFPWTGQFSIVAVEDLVSAVFFVSKKDIDNKTFNCSGTRMEICDFFQMCGIRHFSGQRILKYFSQNLHLILPFKLKAMLLPVLVSDDSELRKLGWRPVMSVTGVLKSIIEREKSRIDVCYGKNNNSLVTGAASGLGYHIAQKLSVKGAKLVLVDKDIDSLREKFNESAKIKLIHADLTVKSGLDKVVSEIEKNDSIVNLFLVAGFGIRDLFTSASIYSQIEMHRLLFEARVIISHEFMKKDPRLGFARIVFISSSSAFQPLPFMSVYAASNSALLSLGRSLSFECKNTAFKILTVCPGGMNSSFQDEAGVKKRKGEKLMEPGFVAEKVFEGLNKDKKVYIISGRAHAMSILSRVLPMTLNTWLWGKLMKGMR